ncbi:response regulator [Desulfospira joergensenii]|uniref:response regulator n=1 Tax=Desulfospira joergensenii TaxID=53329 RepID=UPI0003B75158|nr:response regulator [Desulfospira joergensenii]
MSSSTFSDPDHRPRILVMDDEEQIRDITRAMLEKFGFDTTLAEDGEEAIEKFRNAQEEDRPFQGVLLDLTIPGGMGGKETCERILALDPHASIIVSSGDSEGSLKNEFTKYGFKGILPKPYRIADLKKAVEDLIHPGD